MRVGIALGSNLGDRRANLALAIENLRPLAVLREPFLVSSFHQTAPVDCPPGSGDFLNAAVELAYADSPRRLLEGLRKIENRMGRPAARDRNAPRSIDLDILYCDDLIIAEPDLIVPHPRMHQRFFVLQPLREIVPQRVLPVYEKNVEKLFDELNLTNDK